jgi:hypothetical protein
MSSRSGRTVAMNRCPSLWRTIGQGAFAGAIAASLGVLLYWGGVFAFGCIRARLEGSPSTSVGSSYGPGGVALILVVGTTATILVPSLVGGGTVGLILHRLSSRWNTTAGIGMLIGALMGTLAGGGTFLVVSVVGIGGIDSDSLSLVVPIAGIAALAGAWHGLLMVRWYKRNLDRG